MDSDDHKFVSHYTTVCHLPLRCANPEQQRRHQNTYAALKCLSFFRLPNAIGSSLKKKKRKKEILLPKQQQQK